MAGSKRPWCCCVESWEEVPIRRTGSSDSGMLGLLRLRSKDALGWAAARDGVPPVDLPLMVVGLSAS